MSGKGHPHKHPASSRFSKDPEVKGLSSTVRESPSLPSVKAAWWAQSPLSARPRPPPSGEVCGESHTGENNEQPQWSPWESREWRGNLGSTSCLLDARSWDTLDQPLSSSTSTYRRAMTWKGLTGRPKVIGRQVRRQFQWPGAPPITTTKASKTILWMKNGMCIEVIHLAHKSGQLIAISKMLKSFLKNYL